MKKPIHAGNAMVAAVLTVAAGRELVETPRWTHGAHAELNTDGVLLGLQANLIDVFGRQYLGSIANSRFSADTSKAF